MTPEPFTHIPSSPEPFTHIPSSETLSFCQSSFSHQNRRIIVEMTDPLVDPAGKNIPFFDGGQFTGGHVEDVKTEHGRTRRRVGMTHTPATWNKLWEAPPQGFTEPAEVVGNYCPATFRVHGLPYALSFRIGVSVGSNDAENLEDRTRIVITSMTFEGASIERKLLSRVQTALLLDHAIHASTFIATAYPPDYKTTLGGSVVFDSGLFGGVKPHTLVTKRAKEELRTLKGEKRGRRRGSESWNSDVMIERVAKFWHECPSDYPGGRTKFISDKLAAKGICYHESRYPMIVRLGRDKGLIPEVNEKYNYRKKETKRGKK